MELATKVLRDYYTKAASAELIQSSVAASTADSLGQEMSQAAKAPYKGMQDSSGGIFAMLEVILSDFARLEAETATAEDAAANQFEKFMAESNESIAVKEAAISHKENSKRLADEKAAATRKELEITQEELDAALEYYEKLKTQCVNTGLSYEERVRAREEEIESLKEALKILNQQDLA